ncbi:alcohol dehydrogenase (NADP(+)) [Ranunculus cassubicifolius]
MAKAGIRPREILHALRKNDPGNCTSLHQIYNAIHAIKMKDMDGKNPTQNLPTQLTDDRFVSIVNR